MSPDYPLMCGCLTYKCQPNRRSTEPLQAPSSEAADHIFALSAAQKRFAQFELELPSDHRPLCLTCPSLLCFPIDPRNEQHVAYPCLNSAGARKEEISQPVADRTQTKLITCFGLLEQIYEGLSSTPFFRVKIDPGKVGHRLLTY